MRWILKLATISISLCLVLVSVSQAQLSNTKVAFHSNRDGNFEIYVMNADGTNQTRLTNNTASDALPSWSPNGTKIAFESSRDANAEIYVMNSDGTNQTRLTNNPETDTVPLWSPDGMKIAFESYRDGNPEIYVMNADGTNQTRLTNNPAHDYVRSWSPSVKIAFYSNRDGISEIYVMNSDGTNQTRLTNNSVHDSDPSWSPDGSKIAFHSDRDGNSEIYVMNADGTNQTRLTNNTAGDAWASWSPDGSKIAFYSNRDGNNEIYVMNSDGTNQTRLTNNSAHDSTPSWSPFLPIFQVSPTTVNTGIVNKVSSGTATFTVTNSGGGTLSVSNITSNNPQFTVAPTSFNLSAGLSQTVTVTFRPTVVGWEQGILTITHNGTNGPMATVTANGIGRVTPPTGSLANTKIALTSTRDGNSEIYTMNIDGTNLTRLTNNAAGDGGPSWSPDGTKIAFASNRDGNYEIYIMNADGTNQTRRTNHPLSDSDPSWSPDGTKIAFYSNRDDGSSFEIYVMTADGTNQTRLTNNTTHDTVPSWSPDGTKIAFEAQRDGNWEIYVMNADGTNQIRLTNNTAYDIWSSWSPDGTKIAFYSNRDGNDEIYVMNSDGTNQTRLTNNLATDYAPSWSPDGTKIAFNSNRDGNDEIYVMNSDGTNQTRLTNNSANDEIISWSPFLPIPSASISQITATSAIADGTSTSTITITVRDANGNPLIGRNVTISATGTANTITQPSTLTNSSGQTTATIKSTKAETKTLTATVDSISFQTTVTFIAGSVSPSNSSISASPTTLIADGTAESTVTIILRDANNNLVNGKNVTISATGTGNTITQPASATDANGQATSKIKSTKAEAKTISATVTTDNITLTNTVTVTFTPGPVSASASTIAIPPSPVSTDSTTGATVTVTLKDQFGNPVSGKSVTISSTGTGNTITQPASATDANGQTTATIKSTKAEVKTISATDATDNINLTNTATITFTAGAVSASVSTVAAAPTSAVADNTATITVTVILKDANGNPVSGKNVTVAATGTNNTIAQPASPTDSNGQATAIIKSTKAETKTISATDTTDNLNLTNTTTVTFTAGAVSASVSTITASPTSAIADGTTAITVTVTLKDANGNTISGKNVTISATGTNNTITQPTSATDPNGQTTATIKSTKAEAKTISATDATDNINLTSTAAVTFTAGAVSASVSTISTSPSSAVADNTAAITVTITLKDANSNPVSGKNVTISATGTNNTLTQPTSATDSNGQATATIKSTKAEAKTISATDTTDNLNLTNTATVTFTFGAVSASKSTISVSPTSISVDNVSGVTVTVTLLDANDNPVNGKNVSLSATGAGNTITQPAAPTNVSGQATAVLKSNKAEVKTISATDISDTPNITLTNTATVTFTPGAVSTSTSTVVASPTSALADGIAAITLTITLKDANNNPISGKNVTISASGTSNTITQPTSPTDVNGQTIAKLKSTKAEAKIISAIVAPDNITLTNTVTVTFTPGLVSANTSTIAAAPTSATADGIAAITVTVTLKDANNNPVGGKNVTISATGTANTITQPTAPTDSNGQATATIKSTKAESKTISATDTTDNINLANMATVIFTPGAVSASKSTITVSPNSISVDNASGATVTITLLDATNNPISGKSVTISATGTGNTITQPTAQTDANGQTTAVIKSTKAEAKTISATDTTDIPNITLTNTATVTFTAGAVSASVLTISASPNSAIADNTATITVTVTLKDANGNAVSGKNVTIAATGTGNTITQPASPTDSNGQATATIKSTKAETKTISATDTTDNIALTNTVTVTFTPGPVSASVSTIAVVPTSAIADGTTAITVTVILKDANGNLVSGKNVTVSATGTGNTITQPASATDANGQTTASIKSTKAEVKTISAAVTTDNITLTNTVTITFTPGLVSTNTSTIAAAPTSAIADGTATITVTVTLKDANNNLVSGKNVTISATGTGNTITQPTAPTNTNGQTTATIKSTKAEVKTISATDISDTPNITLTNTATVTFTPGLVSATASTITAFPASLSVEDVAGSTITVTLKDQFGNAVPGKNVEISVTGTDNTITQPSTATDANGQATAKIKSTKAETKTISAKDTTDNIILANTATVTFISGVVSATKSIVVASLTELSVDDPNGSTITVSLKDQFGNLIPAKSFNITVTVEPIFGITVIPSPSFPISADANGQFTFIVKSTKSGVKTVKVTVDTTALAQQPIIKFTSGKASKPKCSITAISPIGTEIATGSTITAILKDQYENPIANKILKVNVAVTPAEGVTMLPAISPFDITTDENGKFSFSVKSAKAESKTVSITTENVELTATIAFLPGPPDPTKTKQSSQIPTTAETDISTPAKIVILLRDVFDNPIESKLVKLTVMGSDNILSPTSGEKTTDIDGKAEFKLASTKAEKKEISVKGDGSPLFTATIDFTPNPVPSPSRSKVSLDRTEQTVGDQEVTIKITVMDKNDNPLSRKQVKITTIPQDEKIIISPPADTNDQGETNAKLKSTKALEVTINVSIQPDNIILDSKPKVKFSPSTPEKIDLKISPSKLPADGKSEADITITVLDKFDNPIKDAKLELSAILGQVSAISSSPKGDGSYTAKYTSGTKAGVDTIKAMVGSKTQILQLSLEPITFTASIIFILPKEARIDDEVTISGRLVLPSEGVQIQAELPIRLIITSPTQKPKFFDLRTDKAKLEFSTKLTVDEKGNWQVEANWEGNNDYKPTKGTDKFIVKKRLSIIRWKEEQPQKVRFGDRFTLQGQLVKPLRKNQTISLKIINPNGVISDIKNLTTNEISSFEYTFTPDPAGEWRFIANWAGDEDSEPAKSEEIIINVNPEWKAIIVQGGGDENTNPDWNKFAKLANDVYKNFKKRHFSDDDIYYLNPGLKPSLARDATTSEAALEFAITDWTAKRVNPKIPLFIYMLSHNLEEPNFLLEKQPGKPDVFLSAAKFGKWLDALPPGTQVVIIIEACYSGNFITQKELGKPVLVTKDRVVITSSSAENQSWIYQSGSFTRLFFKEVLSNKTLSKAFSNAKNVLSTSNLHKAQQPQIDANGNGIPNDQDDLTTVEKRFFPADVISLGVPPTIEEKPKPQKLEKGISSATIEVRVSGVGSIEVTGVITPPSFDSSKSFKSWDELKFDEIKFESKGGEIYATKYDKFIESGVYLITITAENEDGSSIPVETIIEVPSPETPWDVNKDGEVNIFDLVIVASNFGQPIPSPLSPQNPDVNGDGKVDIFDLVLVATHFGEKTTPKASPVYDFAYQQIISDALLDVNLLTQLRELLRSIPNANSGILKAIADLERLLEIARAKNIPSETRLLANYPNPFNPETWIPYQLSKASDVEIRIYDVSGRLVRRLSLGHKEAGMYIPKGKAAYWDGRSDFGERVASGVYFYQLRAGSFSAMRKMLVLK